MEKRLFGFALFILFSAALAAEDKLSIATYNVRNYLIMDRLADGRWRKEYPKPESEKRVIRETIHAVQPDILTLQEIGSQGQLEELRRDLAAEGLVYEGKAWLEAGDTVRHVAALWKRGIEVEVAHHRDLNIKYFGEPDIVKRGLLELKVRDESGVFSIFVAHLKSKYTDNKADPLSNKRRTLEARAVRDRILKLYPKPAESRYMLVGDLNDSPNTSALRAVLKKGDRQLSIPIDATDEVGDRWTHLYKKQDSYSRVDYILRSPGWNSLEGVEAKILRRGDFYQGSDHRLVWVEID